MSGYRRRIDLPGLVDMYPDDMPGLFCYRRLAATRVALGRDNNSM